MNERVKNALIFLIFMLIEIFIGVFVHDDFIRPYVGDMLVVVVIYFFLKIFITKEIKLLPLYIFIFAVCTEIAQYFQIADLIGLGDNRLAKIIIGSAFDIKDILCYLAGCIGLFIYQSIRNKRTA